VRDEDALRKAIQSDFHDLSAVDSRLAHLEDVVVDVRGWGFFLAELSRRLPLRYRWFEGLPPGVTHLLGQLPRKESFKQFLRAETLPFFSRSRFRQEQGSTFAGTEEELISALQQNGQDEALVLSGPGGVGKTRLAIEIARTLQQPDCLALSLSQRAGPEAIATLARASSEPCKVVFVLDYAESTIRLADLAGAIRTANDNGHVFRIVATCRSSSLATVQDGLSELDPRVEVLGGALGAEKRVFNEWVVARILEHGQVPNREAVRMMCEGLPILAAFAVYVYQRHPLAIEAHLGRLVREKGFSSWARRRLQNLQVGCTSGDQPARLLAEFAFQLPITLQETSRIHEVGGTKAVLLERLKNDLWIEELDGSLVASHDLFADLIAAHYLYEAGFSPHDRAVAILRGALRKGHFERAISCFIRLAAHPQFATIDRLRLLEELLATDHSTLLAHISLVIRPGILDTSEILTLLSRFPDLCARASADPANDISIARLARHVNKNLALKDESSDRLWEIAGAILPPLLDIAIARQPVSEFLVGEALQIDRRRYRQMALSKLRETACYPRGGFLIQAWVLSGLPLADIEAECDTWLMIHGQTNWGAALVYRACLLHGVEMSVLPQYMDGWLSRHRMSAHAGVVLSALLRKGQHEELIAKYFAPWLEVHFRHFGAGHAIQAWLARTGDADTVAQYILPWLDIHVDLFGTGLFIKTWLETTGDYQRIKNHVRCWLDLYGTEPNADQVLKTCVLILKHPSDLCSAIGAWMRANHDSPQALMLCRTIVASAAKGDELESLLSSFSIGESDCEAGAFLQAWLKVNRSPARIRKTLLGWSVKHQTVRVAGRIYRLWLKLEQDDVSAIAPALRGWVNVHWEQDEAVSVLRAWIAANHEQMTFDEHVAFFGWAQEEFRTITLYQGWILSGADASSIESNVASWIKMHGEDVRAHQLYQVLLKSASMESIDQHIGRWFSIHADRIEAGGVIGACLSAKRFHEVVDLYLLKWLSTHGMSRRAGKVMYSWLRATDEVTEIYRFLPDWMARYPRDSICGQIARFLYDRPETSRKIISPGSMVGEFFKERDDGFAQGLEIGQIHTGRIKKIVDNGVVLFVAGEEGLLRNRDMALSKDAGGPDFVCDLGREVSVQIISIDCVRRRLGLSTKHLFPDPWTTAATEFPVGSRVRGKISNIMDYGVFVEIVLGLEVLLHRSQIPGGEFRKLKLMFSVGHDISIRVIEIDAVRRRAAATLDPLPESNS